VQSFEPFFAGFGLISRPVQNSIDIRLIGPLEFVDSLQNSIDPLSNEFDAQTTEKTTDYTSPVGHLMAKSSIFVVFRSCGWARMRPLSRFGGTAGGRT
jgi:hypothetical protein